VETIEEGEGGVTKGDIDLLFEDADNELRFIIAETSKLKYALNKLLHKFSALVEQYEYHAAGQVSGTGQAVQKMGGGHGGGGTGGRALRQQQLFDRPSRPQDQKTQAGASPEAKKEQKECVAGLNLGSSGSRRAASTASEAPAVPSPTPRPQSKGSQAFSSLRKAAPSQD